MALVTSNSPVKHETMDVKYIHNLTCNNKIGDFTKTTVDINLKI